MLEIVLATKNKDKIKEIKKILRDLKIKILSIEDFNNIPDVDENGETLEENAIKKAKEISEWTGKIALADDSGLEVDVLDRLPGVRSARFAGENCSYVDNNKKLLKLMRNVPLKKRKAVFKCVMALAFPKGRVKTAMGICRGIISTESRGETGFGYDPVFIIPRYGRTIAELGPEIKNKISHRAKALKKMRQILEDLPKISLK